MKYAPLQEFLSAQTVGQVPVSFADIERIIGTDLPPSAYRHAPWWSNNPSNNTMTKVWLDAGWKTENVDVPNERVTFRRVEGGAGGAGPAGAAEPSRPAAEAVLDRLEPELRHVLETLAMEADLSEAAVAANLLGRVLIEERRRLRAGKARDALARAKGMEPIDTVALIREGREAH